MKNLIYAFIATLVITLTSCDRTQGVSETPNQQSRNSGVLNESPELMRDMKFEASKEFLENGRNVSFVNGKVALDMSNTEAINKANTAARPSKNTGGTTSGGTTTTTGTFDISAPRCYIQMPTAGQVFSIANSNYWACNLYVSADDNVKVTRIRITIKGQVIVDTTNFTQSGSGNWIVVQRNYYFPFGDGTYDMTAQAWDAKGHTTIASITFSRNTQLTPVTVTLPPSWVLKYPKDPYINQGGEGACAAFVAASAYSIERYYKDGLVGEFDNNTVYSPEWVYNISLARSGNTGCGAGSGLMGNMTTIKNRGIPTWNHLPFSQFNGCDTSMFTDAIRNNAALNKVNGYSYISSADVNLIKQRIYQGKAGMFTFQMDRNFVNQPAGYIWVAPHYYDYYTHGAVIVGYDDSKNAFLVLNSWGADWANNGARWIDYSFFATVTTYCFYYN